MDTRPILLPERERLTRKVEELRSRGYSEEKIIEAMGLSPTRAALLLGAAKPPRKSSAKQG